MGDPLEQRSTAPAGHQPRELLRLRSAWALVWPRLRPRWRWSLGGLVLLLLAGVGVSRVYLGVHYPSDIVGGWLAGMAWLGTSFAGLRRRVVRPFAHHRAG